MRLKNNYCYEKTAKLICLLILLTSLNQYAQSAVEEKIPHVISFQGAITDSKGNKLPDGNYDVTFKLYNQAEGGTPLWLEKYNTLKIENGNLQILLGRKNKANPIAARFDKKLYLAISINGELETYKRIELGGSAYSLGSEYAENVADSSITTEKIASLSVTNNKVETLNWEKITDVDPDPYSVYWTILGNIIYGPDRNYVGTIEAKDFVLKTFSIERMRFGPTGRVTLGTPADTVDFVVIGKSKFQNVFIKGNLGIGVLPGGAKVHIRTQDITPFKVDVDSTNRFQVSSNGKVEIKSNITSGSSGSESSYPLYLHGKNEGIAIKVNSSGADNSNNFVSFWNDAGMQGRIEGQSIVDYLSDPLNIARDADIVAMAAADVAAIAISVVDEEVEPASIISFSAGVIDNTVMIALEESQLGVTYESGSGDYAEWLERLDPKEQINPGDIVGLYDGKISKSTVNADQLLCISFSPVVLGNTPEKGKEPLFDKVAFLGQVPVKVYGKVVSGDYIIPSGLNDGSGVAIQPNMMTIDEYTNVVGRAWGFSDVEQVKYVNTAIGFDNNDILNILQLKNQNNRKMNEEIQIRNRKIEEVKYKLNNLYKHMEVMQDQYEETNQKIINTKNNLH